MPLVEPPMAWRTVMALWKESGLRTVVRVRGELLDELVMDRAALTAFLPVSSATRRRVLDTAGAVLLMRSQ